MANQSYEIHVKGHLSQRLGRLAGKHADVLPGEWRNDPFGTAGRPGCADGHPE